ncbi:hypothetical protein CF54_17900 [Streptomyces sp. Tu 6176]|uniref:hypothetical protein n=1 Tax=Streptomyces sp. Tu 6176 TaxID=1470557 RepID=UPI000449665C|nr:hypothetical protein [Streptomyces sp. Tu 6176]EYT81709.1 hypothetical protein CF54_17900 [Streptomyces sp. Tu 6176]
MTAGLCGAGAAVAVGTATGGQVAETVPYLVACGLAAVLLGVRTLRTAGHAREVLRRGPWTACPAVAVPARRGAARLVIRAPDSGELWPLTPLVDLSNRHAAMPPASGVLWWCGDPALGGVVAQPGGLTFVWAQPTRGHRRREADLRAAVAAGVTRCPVPHQPSGAARPSGTPVPPPRRHRALFRWCALLGAVVMGLGVAGSVAAEGDPQVDLKVIQADARGHCTVVWKDPWNGSRRQGPFRCDPTRDAIPADSETGFVVSYGPWKGDLYNSRRVGSPAKGVDDGLALTGFLLLFVSGIGGTVRVVLRVSRRRTARRLRARIGPVGGVRPDTVPVPRTGDGPQVSLVKTPSPAPEEPARAVALSYAVWAELAGRMSPPEPPNGTRRDADVREVPWWRVRSLRQISRVDGVVGGLVCVLIGVGCWVQPSVKTGQGVFLLLLGVALSVVSTRHAVAHGVADARVLARAAKAPVSVPRPYVLVSDPCDGGPVLVLFPAHADATTEPDAVLAVHPSRPNGWTRQGMASGAGTADLRGWLDTGPEGPVVVPWIDGRPVWSRRNLREIRASVAADRALLRHLMGAPEEALPCPLGLVSLPERAKAL